MEIKATLNKPYTEEDRIDFIIEQNHNNGYEIKETELALEAWGLTQQEIEDKEKERISHLKCTKRVFALCLKELGVTYEQLKNKIAENDDAQLEWDLCVELERCNPLIDIMASEIGITSEQLDYIFKYANGEITVESEE